MKKMFGIVLTLLLSLTVFSSAMATTFTMGNTQCGITLTTGGKATAKVSGTNEKSVSVTLKVQYDAIELAGNRVTKYLTKSASDQGSVSVSLSEPALTTGVKAWGKVASYSLGPVGYGVGF